MASTSELPPIVQIPSLSTEERAAILDLLFEPSTQLHTLSIPLLHDQKFSSYDDLIAAVGVQLTDLSESASTSDTAWLQDILGSHPRLGAKKVDSAQSQAEQAQLQGSGEEAEQLRVLNEKYEKAFRGLRYVVFVNGRSRPVIMEDMKERIAGGDLKSEQTAAIRVCTLSNRELRHLANLMTGHVRDCCRPSVEAGVICLNTSYCQRSEVAGKVSRDSTAPKHVC